MTKPARPCLMLVGGTRERAETLGAIHVEEPGDALRRAADGFEAILIDLPEPRQGAALTRLARAGIPGVLVALADAPSLSRTMALMQAGAHEVADTRLSAEALLALIADLRRRHGRDERPVAQPGPLGRLIGPSPQMAAAAAQLRHIAASQGPVFISGEPGSGKSLAAEILHALGQGSGPLRVVDCRAGGLGPAPVAGEGGLFVLDGIEALGPSDQARLARWLREETEGAPRLCCLSALGPAALVSGRHLRQDLFYRLQALALYLPPLRQRPGDIDALVQHVAGRPGALSRAARQALSAHSWPGNVRELIDLVARVLPLSGDGLIEPVHLAAAGFARPAEPRPPAIRPLWQVEQDMIEAAIEAFHGNISLAAEALELSPSTIYRKRQAWAAGRAGAA